MIRNASWGCRATNGLKSHSRGLNSTSHVTGVEEEEAKAVRGEVEWATVAGVKGGPMVEACPINEGAKAEKAQRIQRESNLDCNNIGDDDKLSCIVLQSNFLDGEYLYFCTPIFCNEIFHRAFSHFF